ncbi:hypothetical protein B0F90DRAFT_223950 [Multifurca ochricompacta]|uniref:Secreted protein n=1 Tax=Multifurca ochricompacta TaxID=376703 RepID=A0AAD4LXX4_9AGAM|nr:hypothetical protein B0F90DRAFT_223950 [Multifurca ochricompacta]
MQNSFFFSVILLRTLILMGTVIGPSSSPLIPSPNSDTHSPPSPSPFLSWRTNHHLRSQSASQIEAVLAATTWRC